MRQSNSVFGGTSNFESARFHWGWFIALGVILVFLGFVAMANLTFSTQVTVLYVGAFMAVGGAFQIVHAFQVRSWSGFFYYLGSGVIYAIAGLIAFQNPLLTAVTLTFFLATALIVSGFIRIWSSFHLRPQTNWGWILASGLMTLFAGSVFLMDWPVNTLWLLGMMLSFDLAFQGVSALALGLSMREGKPFPRPYSRSAASAY